MQRINSTFLLLVVGVAVQGALLGYSTVQAQEGSASLLPAVREPEITTDTASFGMRMTMGEKWGRAGIIVLEVAEKGPAASVGVDPGHLILSIEDNVLAFGNDLEFVRWMAQFRAGQTVAMRLLKDQETEALVQVTGRETTEEAVQALARWIGLASARLASGEDLYCREPNESDSPRQTGLRQFMNYARDEFASSDRSGARLVITKEADGFVIDSDLKGAPLTNLSIEADDFPERLHDLAHLLLEGQRMVVSVALGSGSSVTMRVSEHPTYP